MFAYSQSISISPETLQVTLSLEFLLHEINLYNKSDFTMEEIKKAVDHGIIGAIRNQVYQNLKLIRKEI